MRRLLVFIGVKFMKRLIKGNDSKIKIVKLFISKSVLEKIRVSDKDFVSKTRWPGKLHIAYM